MTVPEEGEDRIHRLRTRVRHTTVIVLPPGENILDFVAGDSEYWHLTGAANVVFLKPLASDAATDDARRLWDALRERGRSVEVVAVVRTPRELGRARTILGKWANAATASGPATRCEIDRIEQAIRGMDDAVIEKHGGLKGCLERIVELKDLLRSSRPGTAIDGFRTWRSSRLPGGGT